MAERVGIIYSLDDLVNELLHFPAVCQKERSGSDTAAGHIVMFIDTKFNFRDTHTY